LHACDNIGPAFQAARYPLNRPGERNSPGRAPREKAKAGEGSGSTLASEPRILLKFRDRARFRLIRRAILSPLACVARNKGGSRSRHFVNGEDTARRLVKRTAEGCGGKGNAARRESRNLPATVRSPRLQSRLIAPGSASRALLEYPGVEQRPKPRLRLTVFVIIRRYVPLLPASNGAHRASSLDSLDSLTLVRTITTARDLIVRRDALAPRRHRELISGTETRNRYSCGKNRRSRR